MEIFKFTPEIVGVFQDSIQSYKWEVEGGVFIGGTSSSDNVIEVLFPDIHNHLYAHIWLTVLDRWGNSLRTLHTVFWGINAV